MTWRACMWRLGGTAAASMLLAGCAVDPPPRELPATTPERLSAWQLFEQDADTLGPGADVEPYRLAVPLFTDHAWKLRTIRLPEGGTITTRADGRLQFPVGTVISKTFYYPVDTATGTLDAEAPRDAVEPTPGSLQRDRVRLVETRLLIRRDDGWEAAPYVWNAAGTEATLRIEGAYVPLTVRQGGRMLAVDYMVPDRNQCGGCHVRDHASGELEPLGPRLENLQVAWTPDATDRPSATAGQIDDWQRRGLLTLGNDPLPHAFPAMTDTDAPLARRARAWLDVNCAHCHHPTGAADTSGLFLAASIPFGTQVGRCKPPVAAGRGSGGLRHDIAPGAPEASILVHRMASTDPGVMMPELGRSVTDAAAVALISAWIADMAPACNPLVDSFGRS